MIRAALLLSAFCAALTAGSSVSAQQRAPAASGQGQALDLGTFGDWTAFSSTQGRNKVCYILSKPKDRQPRTLTRDPGFLFVTARPAERVRNEVSFVLGFPVDEKKPGEAAFGQTTFALSPKGRNAWISNAAEENAFIEAARRSPTLTVKATSGRGNLSTDRYSMAGFTQALERMRRECP